jgi:hypothetical protein
LCFGGVFVLGRREVIEALWNVCCAAAVAIGRTSVVHQSDQSKIQGWRTGNGVRVLHTSMARTTRCGVSLRGKGQILWDVTVDNSYVQLMNFLAPGSRDMFDANNKAIDYLFRALCQPEFDRVHTEHLACRIWSVLKEAHVGNA